MQADSFSVPFDDLLAHAGWVRALARRLVSDQAAAEDLVQETWLAALRHPPRDARNIRAWLARLVRNSARQRGRSESARRARETRRVPVRATPSPDELVQRVESQRILAEEVLQLDEHQRSTVLLRYFEGLSAAEIARRTGVPAGTVRWRLKQGLERLRERLDQRYDGDRRAWRLALAPLAFPAEGASAGAATGGLLAALQAILAMSIQAKLGLALLAVVVAVLGIGRIATRPTTPEAIEPVAIPVADVPSPVPEPRSEVGGREVVASEAPEAGAEGVAEADEPPSAVFVGDARVLARVLDSSMQPIRGVRVADTGNRLRIQARDDGEGNIEIAVEYPVEVPDGYALDRLFCRLLFTAEGWMPQYRDVDLQRGQAIELGDILLAPAGRVVGRIVSEQGRPVAGAWIDFESAAAPLRRPLEKRKTITANYDGGLATAHSGEDGAFHLNAPLGRMRLWAGKRGLLTAVSGSFEVRHACKSGPIELILCELPQDEMISGRVLDPSGQPVPRAHLELRYKSWFSSGSYTRSADEEGRFELLCAPTHPRTIRASDPKERWNDAVAEKVAVGTHGLVLRLTAPARLVLAVTDEQGAPVTEYRVGLFDPDRQHAFARSRSVSSEEGIAELAAPAQPFLIEVSAEGHQIESLGPFRPGRLPERIDCELDALPGVRGRVLAGGEPVAGALLALHRPARQKIRRDDFDVLVEPSPAADGTADEQGRYSLTLREGGRFVLRAWADGFAAAEIGPLAIDPEEGLEVADVHLTAGGSIEGYVSPSEGRSPTGTIVGVSRGDSYAQTARVGADGYYRFDHLTPGGWQVKECEEMLDGSGHSTRTWGLGPHARLPVSCAVVEGQVARFDLGAGGGCAVEGHLRVELEELDRWKASLVRAEMRVFSSSDEVSAQLDAEGRFSVSVPEPGRYRLMLDSPALAAEVGASTNLRLWAELELVPGPTIWELDLELGSLSGEGLEPAEGPLPAALYVWERGEAKAYVQVIPDESGRFHLPLVPAGPGRLTRVDLQALDGDPAAFETLVEVEVPAGGSARVVVP